MIFTNWNFTNDLYFDEKPPEKYQNCFLGLQTYKSSYRLSDRNRCGWPILATKIAFLRPNRITL